MSWPYSQALVVAYLAENSLDGQQYALSSGTPTPLLYCAPDRMTEFCRLSRFGMTFKTLTEELGEDVLTWFLADSPAKISAQPEKAQESTEREAECGSTWLGSFAKWDRVTSSWKTLQCSLLEGLDDFSETWPRWGTMRDGECWGRSMPEHLTSETESGLLPTPKAMDSRSAGPGTKDATLIRRDHSSFGVNLAEWVQMDVRQLWPTPAASDADKWSNQPLSERKAKGQQIRLNTAVSPEGGGGGSLNPTWVEWLMGWPLGWTDCAASVTDKFREWCGSHGIR